MITVKSGLADKTRVGFWETHPDHPNGEVLVSGDGEFQVARTGAVSQALGSGRLVEVTVAKAAPPPADDEPPADEPPAEGGAKSKKGGKG